MYLVIIVLIISAFWITKTRKENKVSPLDETREEIIKLMKHYMKLNKKMRFNIESNMSTKELNHFKVIYSKAVNKKLIITDLSLQAKSSYENLYKEIRNAKLIDDVKLLEALSDIEKNKVINNMNQEQKRLYEKIEKNSKIIRVTKGLLKQIFSSELHSYLRSTLKRYRQDLRQITIQIQNRSLTTRDLQKGNYNDDLILDLIQYFKHQQFNNSMFLDQIEQMNQQDSQIDQENTQRFMDESLKSVTPFNEGGHVHDPHQDISSQHDDLYSPNQDIFQDHNDMFGM